MRLTIENVALGISERAPSGRARRLATDMAAQCYEVYRAHQDPHGKLSFDQRTFAAALAVALEIGWLEGQRAGRQAALQDTFSLKGRLS